MKNILDKLKDFVTNLKNKDSSSTSQAEENYENEEHDFSEISIDNLK